MTHERLRPRGTPEQPARGEELYEANCASCHGGATGGDIADIPPQHNAQGHTWHHPDCELIASLAYLLPDLRGGLGAVLEAGEEQNILEEIRSQREPYEFGPGRTYLVEYDEAEDPDGQYTEKITRARR